MTTTPSFAAPRLAVLPLGALRYPEFRYAEFRYPEFRYPEEFDGKQLKSCAKDGLDIFDDNEEETLEECKAGFEPLSKLMKKVLGDQSEKALAGARLFSPFGSERKRLKSRTKEGLAIDVDHEEMKPEECKQL